MSSRYAGRAVLWTFVLTALACHEDPAISAPEPTAVTLRTRQQEANSVRKVLILGSTISGGLQSQEARAVQALPSSVPFQIDVATPAQWRAMTAQQFMSYRALIIGDAGCTQGMAAWQAALDTQDTWGAVVDGNIIVIGSNVASNSWFTGVGELDPVIQGAVEFAAERPRFTGMYISLGCAYQNAAPGTYVDLLEPFGTFKVAGMPTCPTMGHSPAQYPPTFTQHFFDGLLTGMDNCAAKSVFTDYPRNDFSIGGLAVEEVGGTMPGAQIIYDFDWGSDFVGTPFILTRGATSTGFGCGGDPSNIPSGEECDLGDGMNGQNTCSWSCRQEWCGDGMVQPYLDEECDLGSSNGRNILGNISNGGCTEMCKIVMIPPPASSPPMAHCRDVTLEVTNVCGANASIDNGSFDPDNDLVGCVQTPGGPYGIGGPTTVTLTCTDQQGRTASCTGKVTVLDRVVPTISLTGSAAVALQCGVDSYVEQGATARDLCSGDMSSSITKVGSVNSKVPAAYTVSYDVTDAAGNSPAAVVRTVTVSDTLKPTIALLGLANQQLECGTAHVDPGATASDQCAGALSSSIVRSGSVNHMAPNTYSLAYNVVDPSGNAADTKTRLVTVRDTQAPTLTLNGAATQTLECGVPFNDPGATANDLCRGALTVTKSGSVRHELPGSYALVYSATDGVFSRSASRMVTVQDTLAPSITVLGPANDSHECGSPYMDSGATANDLCAGDSSAIIVAEVVGNPHAPGLFTINYTATDPSGNTQTVTGARTVTVNDNEPPVLMLAGPATMHLECGEPYMDPGALAFDACFGDLTNSIVVSGSVNPAVPDAYTVRYNVTDPAGQSAPELTRAVRVLDTQSPVVMLVGPLNQTIECGEPYMDPGAVANDACAGALTAVPSAGVDPNAPGSYSLTYSATDPSGNSATSPQSRTVTVQDSAPPVLVLNGSASQSLECGTAYVDPGATAMDACYGDLSSLISTAGQVNGAVPGTYTLGYSVVDPSGLGASASRTVRVQDTLGPQIQVLPGPSILSCSGAPYVDPGATAFDLCMGDVTPQISVSSNLDQSRPGQYTVTYSVADSAGNVSTAFRQLTVRGASIRLSDYNLFLLGDYNGGHDVLGKVAAGGNITLQDFAVGAGLPASDTARTLVAGGNLTLTRGGVWGDTFHGGNYSANGTVTHYRGTVTKGTPIDFAARFVELRALSAELSGLTANGTTTREPWGGVMLRGTAPGLNVFNVNASAFTGAKLLSIDAPAGSLVVVNIHGASATFTGFGHSFSGGIDQHGVLYNFVDTTAINAHGYGFWGTVLAPYAHINFNNGSWDGGIYAVSLTGNAEGHINVLNDREFCR